MPTNLHIDSDLLEKAQRLGHHRTKRETVNEAMREYTERKKRMESVDLFGSIEFDANFNHKKLRKAR